MKTRKIKIAGAESSTRDCKRLCLVHYKELKINYHRGRDDTYWRLQCERIIAYKVTSKEFSRGNYLKHMPIEEGFFEVLDSPWMSEFGKEENKILDKCKHYVLLFYDETVEIIAQKFAFEQLKEKPTSFLNQT
ncbi:MAG: hypothetical protein AAGI90_06725 [Chlamydiota bacterium]